MSHGGDGLNELAIAKVQMRGAAVTLAASNGLSKQAKANSDELIERSVGALSSLLLIVTLISLTTHAAIYVVPACVPIAALCAVFWLRHHRRAAILRANQLRELAKQKSQEKNNA